MKLISLEVKKLYGCYNYSVNFNSDVTFIYGTNGCGKTTILNITEAIITGQLFKLFNYNFDSIQLRYSKDSNLNPTEIKLISINRKSHRKITVNFNNRDKTIDVEDYMDTRHMKGTQNYYYNSRYDFLSDIKETFNYLYLPLSRSYVPYNEADSMYHPVYNNRVIIEDDMYVDNNSKDGAMLKIASIISKNHSRANSIINRINDQFRNSILKSQIELNNSYDISVYYDKLRKNDIEKLNKIQSTYIKTLKELNLIDDSEEKKYNSFFTKFINDFSIYKENGNLPLPIELFMRFQEILRIQKTIDIAERMEQEKASIMQPMETFLNTMNSFIGHNEEGKELCINSDGQIYFKTKYSKDKISIQHLSSGEKQLITFFANLIFMVKDKSSGIFVVDEPELSLHLSWQKIFIDKLLEINKNIQLIFATHAPEIIGGRRDKMYKLEKQFDEVK